MAISLKEERGKLIVTGPYNEMKDVYPKLKTRGFNYDSSSKAWWIDVSKLTPAKRKNIEVLVRGDKSKGVENPPVTQESKEAQREAWRELAKDLSKTKLYAIQVQVNNPYFFILHIGGDTYPVKDLIKSHGGKWENRYWELDLSKVPEAKARELFQGLEKVSKQRAVRAALIEDRIGNKPRVWPNCKTTLYIADGGIVTLKMAGYNLAVKKLIDQYLSDAKASGDTWRASTYNLSDSDIKHFIEGMDEQEVIEEKKSQEVPTTVTPTERGPEQVSEKGRTNRKPGHCNKCRGWVEVGEGTLHGYFDDDEEKMTYYVEHRDKSVCESNLAMARAVAEKGRSRSLALANLRKMICTAPNFVDPPAQGYLDLPSGTRYEISASGYGGGNSVIVEPGERHVWFIQGNSADGDDWGRNNIGGHSMGWRTDLTDEIKGLIEVVVDRKIWSS